jgi:hypothetical protein
MFPIAPTINNKNSSVRLSIREVNMQKMYVQGTDAYGKSYQVSLSLPNPLVSIPQVNELWRLKRDGNDWILDRRMETGSENTPMISLAPGDRRLEASNKLYLNGENVVINGHDFALLLAQIAALQQAVIALGGTI